MFPLLHFFIYQEHGKIMTKSPNHLIHESSPYLQQHAHNPVEWYPWGNEALELARKENKPILLSIGYASCHWCHVMAHDTFEDEETTKVMNDLFINIKVDREERPDLDKIYQATHYILTQRGGGWPLNVFLSPQSLMPFFSGTYFPAKARDQMPAFADVLQQLSDIYQNQQDAIQQQNADLERIITPPPPVISDVRLNKQPIQHALQVLQGHYDPVNGGFGGAPKFPQASRLLFLLHEKSALAPSTLQHMASGGICDQLGGGFFRYTVDEKWRIPHFEKMLYDNAQLLYLYAIAYKEHDREEFAEAARHIAKWTMTVMQSPKGGYYSSMDADSEGHEGKYYIWDKSEIKKLLSEQEYSVIDKYYGLNHPANFENQWHFYIAEPLEKIANEFNLTIDNVNATLQSAKQKLLVEREKRIPPAIDTKILTAWNGLMIKAMLTAGEILNEPEFINSAQQALTYIKNNLWKNNRLFSSGNISGYLDDYAFLMDASINFDPEFTQKLADGLLEHFQDKDSGGFYFTADDHEKLLYRPKNFMDEAIPSGNAVAARVLLQLGDARYKKAAEKTMHAAWPLVTQYPAEHSEMLIVLDEILK